MWELAEEELAVWALASSNGLYATANQGGGTRQESESADKSDTAEHGG